MSRRLTQYQRKYAAFNQVRITLIRYTVNYGYIKGVIAADGEDQDAYILGVDKPVTSFSGVVIAVIHRLDDVEDKWVVAPEGMTFTAEQIEDAVRFQEKFFKTQLIYM